MLLLDPACDIGGQFGLRLCVQYDRGEVGVDIATVVSGGCWKVVS